MATTKGRLSDVYVTSGAPAAMVNEPLTIDATRKIFTVTNPAKRYWDPGTPLVFRLSLDSGGTWNPVVPDAVQLVGGIATFLVAQQAAPLAQVQVTSGSYLPYVRLGQGHEWDLNPAQALLEDTSFGMTSRHYVAAQIGEGSASVKRWWIDGSLKATLGNRIALVLFVDASAQPAGPRYECFARLKSDAIKVAAHALIEEDLTFEIDGDVSFLLA